MPWLSRYTIAVALSPGSRATPLYCGNDRRTAQTAVPASTTASATSATSVQARMRRHRFRACPSLTSQTLDAPGWSAARLGRYNFRERSLSLHSRLRRSPHRVLELLLDRL